MVIENRLPLPSHNDELANEQKRKVRPRNFSRRRFLIRPDSDFSSPLSESAIDTDKSLQWPRLCVLSYSPDGLFINLNAQTRSCQGIQISILDFEYFWIEYIAVDVVFTSLNIVMNALLIQFSILHVM